MLKNNSKAPNFKLLSTTKGDYSLKDSLGKYVVIYFYPKDDTPGCTIETNDFNKLLTKQESSVKGRCTRKKKTSTKNTTKKK